MTAVLLGAALTLLALPAATARIGRRLRPSEWARFCAVALAAGALLLEIGLLAWAAPTLLRAVGVPSLASACDRLLSLLTVGGEGLGWAAAVSATILPLVAAVTAGRLRAGRRSVARELWLGEGRTIAGQLVVVLPIDRPLAISFADPEPTIVVSTGLLEALEPHEVEAVVRHEVAHLVHRHQPLLCLVALITAAFGWLPPVRSSAGALHLALERWADEVAAGTCPVARLVVRDALLHLAIVEEAPLGMAAFSPAGTVSSRMAALEAPPSPPSLMKHALLYLPGTGASLVAIPALLAWTTQANAVLAMAGRCPV